MARGVGTVAVSAVLQQMVKKFPTNSSGYATLFDFVVYNGRKLLIGVKSVVYDFFVSGLCRCAKFGRNQSSTAASIENASSVSL